MNITEKEKDFLIRIELTNLVESSLKNIDFLYRGGVSHEERLALEKYLRARKIPVPAAESADIDRALYRAWVAIETVDALAHLHGEKQ